MPEKECAETVAPLPLPNGPVDQEKKVTEWLRFSRALHLGKLLLTENGVLWTGVCLIYGVAHYGLGMSGQGLLRIMSEMELRRQLPGMNSRKINQFIWEHWEWSEFGEEWTDSKAWKEALLHEVMEAQVEDNTQILEIGPGGGRWSMCLAPHAAELVLADLSETSLATCRERFQGHDHIRYLKTDGKSLEGVATQSIDFVWSFDVFVHITAWDIQAYLYEIARVLRPGGKAVIHHPQAGGLHGAWRSRVTKDSFREMAEKAQLEVVQQLDHFSCGTPISPHCDTITVLRVPRSGP